MPSGFIGKIGNDQLGNLFKSALEQYGVKTKMLYGTKSSGRCMVFITGANAERTFADYMGSALEMGPDDLKPEYFEGYDYFHIEGYLVQNQELISRAAQMAKAAGCKISIDMASYNVVESNDAFFHNLVERYVDIVFANESEARAFTKTIYLLPPYINVDRRWFRASDDDIPYLENMEKLIRENLGN
jgi:sugar/nucleoside kinase (ribokinase family)